MRYGEVQGTQVCELTLKLSSRKMATREIKVQGLHAHFFAELPAQESSHEKTGDSIKKQDTNIRSCSIGKLLCSRLVARFCERRKSEDAFVLRCTHMHRGAICSAVKSQNRAEWEKGHANSNRTIPSVSV